MCSTDQAVSLCCGDTGSHVCVRQFVHGSRPPQPRMADQARGAAKASIAFPQRLRLLFSPAAKARHSSREVKKAGSRRPSLTLRAKGLRADRSPVQGSPSRLRWARPEQQTETTMATIGSFAASDNGFTGSIKTLTLNIKAKFAPSDKENDKAPDYRIFAGATEFGAALEEDRARQRSRISFGEARRSELSGTDLRLAGEGRRRRGLHPDLVAPQRRLILTGIIRAPPLRRRGFFCFRFARKQREHF